VDLDAGTLAVLSTLARIDGELSAWATAVSATLQRQTIVNDGEDNAQVTLSG